MKRILSYLLALALLAAFVPVYGGDGKVYSFGFDFDPIVEGWTFVDGDGDGVGWDWSIGNDTINTMSGYCMFSESRDLKGVKGDLMPDNWMISPAITVPTNGATVILYAATQDVTAYHDCFALYVGTSKDTNSMERLSSEDDFFPRGDGFYALYGASLENYAGQTVYIAVRHFECYGQSAVCIDEFAVGDYDVPEDPNLPIPIHFDPQGGYVENDTGYNEGKNAVKYTPFPTRKGYCFDGWYTADGSQVFSSKTYVSEETTFYAHWVEGQPYKVADYGFEDDMALNGWLMLDRDGDGNGWEQISSFVKYDTNIIEGSASLCSASADKYGGVLTPDNWAISPEVRLPSGNVTLSFSAVAQDELNCREHFAVYVGKYPVPEDMTRVSGEEDLVTDGSGHSKVYKVDLSAWAGQTVCIALRHYNTGGQYMLIVDAMEIQTDVECFDLWVDGRQVTGQNAKDILGNGSLSFNGKTNTLTVSGNCESDGVLIESRIDGLTVDVTKDAVLKSTGSSALVLFGDTLIKGKGALTVQAQDNGIYMDTEYGILTLQGIDLTVSGYAGITANAQCEMLFFIGCSVTAQGPMGAITDFGNGFIFTGAKVTEPAMGLIGNGTIYEDNGTDAAKKAVIQPEPMLGDADGDAFITSTDARLTLQLAVNKIKDSDVVDPVMLDVDGDESVTSTDARLILQFSVGKIGYWPMPVG